MSAPSLDFDKLIENAKEHKEKTIVRCRECPVCHLSYKYGNSYWQHVRYVHASFLTQCVICHKCYKRTTMAKHHILHRHKIAWHLCSNYVRRVRKNELMIQSSAKQRTAKGATFFKKKTLHLIRSFNCFDCPESFPTIKELFQHVRVHRVKKEPGDGHVERITKPNTK